MIINIDSNLTDFLTSEATADNTTPEVWCERKLNAILLSRMRESIVTEIVTKKIEDVKTIKTAVTEISEAIKIRDYVESIKEEPIELPEIKPEEATTTEEIIK